MDKNVHKGHRKRVKARYLKNGLESFENHQALELLLFYAYPLRDTNEIAHRILNEFGSIHVLFETDPLEISRRCKVSENVATLISMVLPLYRLYFSSKIQKRQQINTSKLAGEFCKELFAGRKYECFYIICLNSQRQLIEAHKLFDGTIGETPIYPREVVESVLKYQASNVILAHNHPSGVLAPSRSDLEATKKIKNILEPLNVTVIDHVIVSTDSYLCFSEKNYLNLGKEY